MRRKLLIICWLLILVICGCSHTPYELKQYNKNGILTKHLKVSRTTWFLFGQANYVNNHIDPNGTWDLTAYDILIDPEKIKLSTMYGIIESGDDNE